MATTYLTRTTGTPTNSKKFTVSGWFKISWTDSGDHQFFQQFTDASNREHMYFSNYTLRWYCNSGGSTAVLLKPNMLFKDNNAWYHIVIACDTTQATASNRVKIYVNGLQVTSFDTANYPSQNFDFLINSNNKLQAIGRYMGTNNYYYDGIISHFHFIDGTQYAASDFGETDSTTGEWKIKTNPSVTYGNNGFFILKDGNSVTDQSGEGNNFTVAGGTLTKTEDCPSNVFATLNSADNFYAQSTFSNGNNNIVFNNTNECFNYSTLGMSTGKFYFEGKQISYGSASERNYFGVTYSPPDASTDWLGNNNYSWGYRSDGKVYNSAQLQGTYSSFANGDIIGVALDVTNSKLYFSKNGVWQNSADPAAGSNGLSVNADKTYFFAIGETTGGSGVESATNFGNGYFKTTAVSSAGTNASNNGIFEYDVPTGYTALSTKGLNL